MYIDIYIIIVLLTLTCTYSALYCIRLTLSAKAKNMCEPKSLEFLAAKIVTG